jgi:hypothetical protein
MGATKIMVVRHAEKPGVYNGQSYAGIDALGVADDESLVTLGWERAGGLAAMFDPQGQVALGAGSELVVPQFLYAADPRDKDKGVEKDNEPSQRPYQTISALAAKLGSAVPFDASYKKKHYKDMVTAALRCDGIVLVSWQHEDIPSIGGEILSQTGTGGITVPQTWPGGRYDLVWVFDRPSGAGPITAFTQVPQLLLAGDQSTVIPG